MRTQYNFDNLLPKYTNITVVTDNYYGVNDNYCMAHTTVNAVVQEHVEVIIITLAGIIVCSPELTL